MNKKLNIDLEAGTWTEVLDIEKPICINGVSSAMCSHISGKDCKCAIYEKQLASCLSGVLDKEEFIRLGFKSGTIDAGLVEMKYQTNDILFGWIYCDKESYDDREKDDQEYRIILIPAQSLDAKEDNPDEGVYTEMLSGIMGLSTFGSKLSFIKNNYLVQNLSQPSLPIQPKEEAIRFAEWIDGKGQDKMWACFDIIDGERIWTNAEEGVTPSYTTSELYELFKSSK